MRWNAAVICQWGWVGEGLGVGVVGGGGWGRGGGVGLSGQVFPAHFSAFQACPVYRPIAEPESDGDRDGERNRAELGKHQYFFIAST